MYGVAASEILLLHRVGEKEAKNMLCVTMVNSSVSL